MTNEGDSPIEVYRKAELRLRLLLLGDGVDNVGRVTGEEHRQQVTISLRRMRTAVEALLEREAPHRLGVGSDARLDDDLQNMASSKSRLALRNPCRPS